MFSIEEKPGKGTAHSGPTMAKISDTYSVKIVKTNLYVSVCLSRQFGNKETGVNTFSIVIASRKNALEPHTVL